MLCNLTCERGFHSALLEADVTYTLLELLGSSSISSTKKNAELPSKDESTMSVTLGGGVVGGSRASGVSTALKGSAQSSGAAPLDSNRTSINAPGAAGGESARDSSSGGVAESTTGEGVGAAETIVVIGGNPAGGSNAGGGHAADTAGGKGPKSKNSSNSPGGRGSGVGLVAAEAAGAGRKPSLHVRRNVLGAVMNLTSMSIEDPRLEPSAVMSLLTLIMHEDPNER